MSESQSAAPRMPPKKRKAAAERKKIRFIFAYPLDKYGEACYTIGVSKEAEHRVLTLPPVLRRGLILPVLGRMAP